MPDATFLRKPAETSIGYAPDYESDIMTSFLSIVASDFESHRISDGRRGWRAPIGRFAFLLLAVFSIPHFVAASEPPVPERKGAPAQKQNAPAEDAAPTGAFELIIVGPDKKPIPKVQIDLRATILPSADQVKVGTFDRGEKYRVFMTTNDEGRLVFSMPHQSKRFELFLTHPGFGPYCARWVSENSIEPVPSRVVAELEAGWSVGSIIVDEDGKPVEGVVVNPSIELKKRPGDNQQLGSGAQVKTDAAGRWHFDSVPVSMKEVHVEIKHPRYRPTRTSLTRAEYGIDPESEAAAKITLDPGLTVTGKITDENGKPVAGALIRTKFLNDIRESKSGDDGAYQLRACEPVETRIVVSAPGRALDMQQVRIAPDMNPVDFQMQPGGKVRVRVVDRDGQPVPKARIFFQRWRDSQIRYFEFDHVHANADENGVWEWNEAPLDEFQADICPPDGITLPRQPIVAREEEHVFKTYPVLAITGRVVDAETGKPIEKFEVLPGIRGEENMNWVESQRFRATDGKFTVRHRHGYPAHLVRVEASGYLPSVSRDVKSDEGDVAITFELKKGKDVLAKVVDQKAQPMEGAKVVLGIAGSQISIKNGDVDEGSTYATQLKTDEAGKFRFPPQDKEFQLVITHPSGFAYLKSTPDWPQLKIIRLEPWARVEGTFRVGSRAMTNVPLTINTSSPRSYGKDVPSIFTHYDVTTGPKGEFTFERVFPGQASIGRRIMLTVNDGASDVVSSCLVRADFPGGETSRIELGGTGRPATGRLAPPDGFEGDVHWNFALISVRTTNEDRENRGPYFSASVARDGTFRIDDMPAGEYTLSVRFSKQPAGALPPLPFVVPAIEGKQSDVPVDLGVLKLIRN